MTATDLIRLAQELAECGGVHRLTSLINAASHVHLEHERARIGRLESCLRAILAADERGQGLPFAEAMDEAARLVCWDGKPRARTVEAWEDGPETGVGMSDKAASGAWSPPPHWSQRGAPSRAPERDVAFGRCVQNAENVEESTTSCYNRPVEVVEHPDGSDHRQEGPRQWLKEPYPSGDTISSGLPICTSMPGPMGWMSASTAETQPTPSITFALSGTSRDCSTISPIMPTGFDMGSLPSLVAETATADSAGSSPTASAKSAKSLSDGCDASTSISSANTIGSQRNLPNLDTVSEATSRDRKPSETGSCPGSTSPGHGKPGCCEPATEHSAPEGRGALAGTPDGLREVKLEPGWLGEQFKAAQEVLDALPPSLREQTPARRNARAMDKCDEHDFRRSNPAPLTSINGERKPLPATESDHG